MEKGDRVRLSENVLHAEFKGILGTIKKIVKTKNIIEVTCDNGKPYRAYLSNVEPIS